MKTAALFVGGMAAGAALLYFGLAAYLTADSWLPRRLLNRRLVDDLDPPDNEPAPHR